jgi:hypothetical protein
MPNLHLSTFAIDATVPIGHALCGGWIKPAESVTDPLRCLGVVLLGDEAPVVLCAVDWTGVCNDAHRTVREKLAAAAHTTPERVAVHAVHQHNAPFADPAATALVKPHPGLPLPLDVPWFEGVVRKAAAACRASLANTSRVTHVGHGEAAVEQIASNRRILGPSGKLTGWRGSSCKDPKLRDAPEGVIDPLLKTVSFWDGDHQLAALHYYAVHPMSYYGDGKVNADFVGLARERRTKADGVPHLYFTGCAGNVAAGKYNDGSPEERPRLSDRVEKAMVAAAAATKRAPVARSAWRSRPVVLPPRTDVTESALEKLIADPTAAVANRVRAAMKLAYRRRAAEQPIHLGYLDLGDGLGILHLPAECFIEYQLGAQKLRPGSFLATAAYGDGGPWYIPTAAAYPQGGYEPSVSWVDPGAEEIIKGGIEQLAADSRR